MISKHVQQPRGSYICSQCSVAMVGGIELQESFELFGHEHASNLGEIWDAVQKLGLQEQLFVRPAKDVTEFLQGFGIMRVYVEGRDMGHAMAFSNGKIYDPESVIYDSIEEWRAGYVEITGHRWELDYILYLKN